MYKEIKVFCKLGVAAVLKELKQMHDIIVMDPKKSGKMTTGKKNSALQYLMFLKQKRCGKINGRVCVDGRKYRKYLTKDNTSAPIMVMEALFLTCLINAMEHQKLAMVDIPGAFMQSDVEGETVHMNLEGKLAELLTKLNLKIYQKYVRNKKGRTVLFVELKKSRFSTLQAALLFWRNFMSSLQEWGFGINPYGFCMENKTVNEKQMKIVWHVDKLDISHENGDTVENLINKISKKYGKEVDLTIHRGKDHEYLGMKLNYRNQGKVKIDMTDYLKQS